MIDKEFEHMNDVEHRIYGYKSEYERAMKNAEENCTERTINIHSKLIKLLKSEELTYEEAYAALQLVHITLKHESEFVNLHQ